MTFVLIFAKHRNWTAALRDFTEILQQDPEDSKAYTYRARAYAKMVYVMNRFFRALSLISHCCLCKRSFRKMPFIWLCLTVEISELMQKFPNSLPLSNVTASLRNYTFPQSLLDIESVKYWLSIVSPEYFRHSCSVTRSSQRSSQRHHAQRSLSRLFWSKKKRLFRKIRKSPAWFRGPIMWHLGRS